VCEEYKESEQREHAKDELIEVCSQYEIKKYQFVGYFFINALSEKPREF